MTVHELVRVLDSIAHKCGNDDVMVEYADGQGRLETAPVYTVQLGEDLNHDIRVCFSVFDFGE